MDNAELQRSIDFILLNFSTDSSCHQQHRRDLVSKCPYGVHYYIQSNDKAATEGNEEEHARRKLSANVITLDGWRFTTNPDSAKDISVSVTVSKAGRFAVGATGRDPGDYGEWYFTSENEQQRMVTKGEHFDYHIPLRRSRNGIPKNISITLYLFDDSPGGSGRGIIKIFQSFPISTEDDGQYYYTLLPKSTTNP